MGGWVGGCRAGEVSAVANVGMFHVEPVPGEGPAGTAPRSGRRRRSSGRAALRCSWRAPAARPPRPSRRCERWKVRPPSLMGGSRQQLSSSSAVPHLPSPCRPAVERTALQRGQHTASEQLDACRVAKGRLEEMAQGLRQQLASSEEALRRTEAECAALRRQAVQADEARAQVRSRSGCLVGVTLEKWHSRLHLTTSPRHPCLAAAAGAGLGGAAGGAGAAGEDTGGAAAAGGHRHARGGTGAGGRPAAGEHATRGLPGVQEMGSALSSSKTCLIPGQPPPPLPPPMCRPQLLRNRLVAAQEERAGLLRIQAELEAELAAGAAPHRCV